MLIVLHFSGFLHEPCYVSYIFEGAKVLPTQNVITIRGGVPPLKGQGLYERYLHFRLLSQEDPMLGDLQRPYLHFPVTEASKEMAPSKM